MFKAVIFDLDGTLLNTIEDLANACNYALSQCEFPTHQVEKYKTFVGDGRYKLIQRIVPQQLKDEETINRVLSLFDEYYEAHMIDMTKPYDGIIELLDELNKAGLHLAVVSNKPHEFAVGVVEKFFGDKIHLTFGHRSNTPTKPDPYSVIEAMDKFGVDKSKCVYIGDSDVDINTAKNAGIKSVGVAWGFRGAGELLEAGADFIVNTTEELKELILN